MKREILTFTVQRPKVRAHRVLFQDDSPFVPRVERNRRDYCRRAKHQARQYQDYQD